MRTGELVIDRTDSAPDWDAYGTDVRKIVLGRLEGALGHDDSSRGRSIAALPVDLTGRFPALTHLHLWSLADLRSLPTLPDLACLDVRGCVALRTVPPLPASLAELILDDAAHLEKLELPRSLDHLWDLSLKSCAKLPDAIIHQLLASSPHLRRLDLSGCELGAIRRWPRELERIDLNHCRQLERLPERWPATLRRLGLRGASMLSELPPFDRWPDYVDLAGAERLEKIQRPTRLRTLFLYGSGLRVPPASEHGSGPDENAAQSTLSYFEDVNLCGTGDVKRCKLLILGNGDAGKTCLSLALAPGGDPRLAQQLGSTHGVQFWDWELKGVQVGSFYSDVALQLWDFGGQEIYHNTHRLFMSKGAVFVVAWKPEQDWAQPPAKESGHQDVWRPLQYWLDFIHLACPWQPRIAVVCTHHARKTDDLEQRMKSEMGRHRESCDRFYVDSLHRAGQIEELQAWIERNVGEVVSTQGTAVPAHWEIAQDLVSRWLLRSDPDRRETLLAGEHDELSLDDFSRLLGDEIERRLASPEDAERFTTLRSARDEGRFALTPQRVTRTLEFLTHSGWVFWDRSLFEQRVVVGQKWALDGIYAALDRRPGTTIFAKLRARRGQFTPRDLDEWVWGEAGYTREQQELLISFMQQVGVCFPVVSERESLWCEPVYCSFEHLPTAAELDLQRPFDPARAPVHGTISSDRLHRLHWNAILGALGARYGRDAAYAVDGFELRNKEGQHIRVLVQFGESGLGGDIAVHVAGPEAEARLAEMVPYVRSFLPAADPLEQTARPELERDPGGERREVVTVFVSYAWQPRTPEEQGLVEAPVAPDYEEPVNRIEQALEADRGCELWRDKSKIRDKESVSDFMRLVRKADKVLLVHSDKYWRSPYCMYEFSLLMGRFLEAEDNIEKTVLAVGLQNSGIEHSKTLEAYKERWSKIDSLPSRLAVVGVHDVERFKTKVMYAFDEVVPRIHDRFESRLWSPESAEQVVEWVRSELHKAAESKRTTIAR